MPYHPVSHWLDRLRRGWKWCGSCGLPTVHPAADAIRCQECGTAEIRWCVSCGTGIDQGRIDFCRSKGYALPRLCWYCKKGATMPHIVHGVRCPPEWHATDMIVYRTAPVPTPRQ